MPSMNNVTHHLVYKDPEHMHCCNQVSIKALSNGEVMAVFNEERYPYHHDSGQAVLVRSKDGGQTWDQSTKLVVLPYTETSGNWDCALSEISNGILMINLTMNGFYKKGITPDSVSWSSEPHTEEWGDWTWSFRLKSWWGTFVLKSADMGYSWGEPLQVNVRPLKHGGTRLGAWEMPNGSLFLGVYGHMRGYGLSSEYEAGRTALMRSDDGGDNWEYYSTITYDPAGIIDYLEPALLRLPDGRMVCAVRSRVRPSGDEKNIAIVVSEDEGFSWSEPKWTNIWGFPVEFTRLHDGRYLMVYGYRRPPYGVRACVSEDGLNWEIANEFIIRQGGVPSYVDEEVATQVPTHRPGTGQLFKRPIDLEHPGLYQHIGYPSVTQLEDGTIVVGYHEWSQDPRPIQYVLCTRFKLVD